MRKDILIKTGLIFALTGFIFLMWSLFYSFPIKMANASEKVFNQFHPLTWPAISILCLGIFILAYFSEKKITKAFCASVLPLILYSYVYFFSYVPSSDCGNVRSMFIVFNQVGISPEYVPYFQYPSYFVLNDISAKIISIDVNAISFIYFSLYGFLLGLFLFMLYTNIANNENSRSAFLYIVLYFVGAYSFLNFQWVPQTLALVYMFILLYISLILYRADRLKYKYLGIFVFIPFIFSHSFLPIIFLIFFGMLVIKKNSLRNLFILMLSASILVNIYFTTNYFPFFIETLQQSFFDFGSEYATKVTQSFQPAEDFISTFISSINRIRIPLIWISIAFGSFIMLFKKKMNSFVFLLGFAGALYFIAGLLVSVLGLRSIQIILIPLVVGMGYFIKTFKKPSLLFIALILLIAVFGPMSEMYDTTQFHTDEEANACIFLAANVNKDYISDVATNQVNFGFFKNLYRYNTLKIPSVCRSANPFFYEIFNQSMKTNNFVIYNPNLEKEILDNGMEKNVLLDLKKEVFLNNKIYSSDYTFIMNGVNEN